MPMGDASKLLQDYMQTIGGLKREPGPLLGFGMVPFSWYGRGAIMLAAGYSSF